jgi:glycosyltransferase involved in cell wall biosynthesis
MRIAVLNLTSGGLSGGYRKYLREIVPRLAKAADVEAISVLAPAAASALHALGDAAIEEWPAGNAVRRSRWIKEKLRAFRPDVVFIPTARLMRLDYPTVVMVRNMEPLTTPYAGNSALDAVRNTFRRAVARRACRDATRVIAVSEFVSDFLTEVWRLPAKKIAVIPHGVTPAPEESATRPSQLSDAPTLFTAGSIRPARGLEDLWIALAELGSQGERPTLAIAGAPDPGTERYSVRLRADAETLGIARQITWLGQLDAREMAWCFRKAGAFVMTSRVEACPNVALEAMSSGALCISSDNPPLPEFFADTARFYPAGDGIALAGVIKPVLSEPSAAKEARRESARRRAGDFTWDASAERTLSVLRDAAGGAK